MEKNREFGCGYDHMPEWTVKLMEEKKLRFPHVYMYREEMAKLSLAVKEYGNLPFCMLPFSHLTEAEAFGGKVCWGDGKRGPRGGNYICKTAEEILCLPRIDYSTGRIKEVLEACRLLKEQGHIVLLEISGPFTIMNALIDIGSIFRAMRKKPDVMREIFLKMKRELLRFLEEAAKFGVSIISYGDPVSGEDILGPEDAKKVAKQFTATFLKEAEKILGDSMMVILCPGTMQPLLDSGQAFTVKRRLPDRIEYGKACVEMAGKIHFTGQMCIKNMHFLLENGEIEEMKLL